MPLKQDVQLPQLITSFLSTEFTDVTHVYSILKHNLFANMFHISTT